MKVHVTLKRSVVSDATGRRAALARVLAEGHMSLGNPGRFERHGIITGEVNPLLLERLRAIPEVDAAEVDEEEGITGHGPAN